MGIAYAQLEKMLIDAIKNAVILKKQVLDAKKVAY